MHFCRLETNGGFGAVAGFWDSPEGGAVRLGLWRPADCVGTRFLGGAAVGWMRPLGAITVGDEIGDFVT